MSKANAWLCVPMTVLAMSICGPLRAADDQVRVVPASELEQWWKVAAGYEPRYPSSDPNQPIPTGCMAVAFEIQSDGSVSNERVWRTTLATSLESKRLERGVLLAMHQSHFVPAPANKNNNPVYTYKIFTYGWIPWGSDDHEIQRSGREDEAKCEMKDFPQQVQAMISAAANAKGATQ